MLRSLIYRLIAVVIGLLHGFSTAEVWAQTPFFQGKTIRIVVSQSPGGGFDAYSRALARHLGKYIDGNPATIVQNMPGAGNMIAVNYLYRVANPDGLTIGNFVGGVVLEQLLGKKGIEFDARRFEWIGVPIKYQPACVLTKRSGIATLTQWVSAKTPVKLGGTGPGSTSDQIPRVLAATLGLLLQRGVYDPAAITLPYMLPPGTPKQRVQELRRAFQETLMRSLVAKLDEILFGAK